MHPPDTCPQCGAIVPPNARACPECGADEQTGWSDDAHADRLGIPSENFDYHQFVEEEFGAPPRKRPTPSLRWLWWLVALGLALVLLRPILRLL